MLRGGAFLPLDRPKPVEEPGRHATLCIRTVNRLDERSQPVRAYYGLPLLKCPDCQPQAGMVLIHIGRTGQERLKPVLGRVIRCPRSNDQQFRFTRALTAFMPPEPPGPLDKEVHRRQVAHEHIEIQIQRLFDHLRRDQHLPGRWSAVPFLPKVATVLRSIANLSTRANRAWNNSARIPRAANTA